MCITVIAVIQQRATVIGFDYLRELSTAQWSRLQILLCINFNMQASPMKVGICIYGCIFEFRIKYLPILATTSASAHIREEGLTFWIFYVCNFI